jgi:hypothetical protein
VANKGLTSNNAKEDALKNYFKIALILACIMGAAFIFTPMPARATNFEEILFIHHSVGEDLINNGEVRSRFTSAGYHFWDHGYNYDGLRDPNGNSTGRNFNIPDDNTDPEGYYNLFQEGNLSIPGHALNQIMMYEVIMFKSCYPAASIPDETTLADYKRYYLSIRDFMDRHPEKIFIPFTTPARHPAETNATEAANARAFANWLTSSEYTSGHPNVFPFNFFGLLADSSNMLRPEYRPSYVDSHPNERAGREIGPVLVNFVINAIQSYRASGGTSGSAVIFFLNLNAPSYRAGDNFVMSMACWGHMNPMDLYLLAMMEDQTIINMADGAVITVGQPIQPAYPAITSMGGSLELVNVIVPPIGHPLHVVLYGILVPHGADIYHLSQWLAWGTAEADFR